MIVDNIELALSLNLDKALQQLEELKNQNIDLFGKIAPASTQKVVTNSFSLTTEEKDYYQQSEIFQKSYLSEARKQTRLLDELLSYYRTVVNVVVQGKGGYDSDNYGIPITPSPDAPRSPTSDFIVKLPNSPINLGSDKQKESVILLLEKLNIKQESATKLVTDLQKKELRENKQQWAELFKNLQNLQDTLAIGLHKIAKVQSKTLSLERKTLPLQKQIRENTQFSPIRQYKEAAISQFTKSDLSKQLLSLPNTLVFGDNGKFSNYFTSIIKDLKNVVAKQKKDFLQVLQANILTVSDIAPIESSYQTFFNKFSEIFNNPVVQNAKKFNARQQNLDVAKEEERRKKDQKLLFNNYGALNRKERDSIGEVKKEAIEKFTISNAIIAQKKYDFISSSLKTLQPNLPKGAKEKLDLAKNANYLLSNSQDVEVLKKGTNVLDRTLNLLAKDLESYIEKATKIILNIQKRIPQTTDLTQKSTLISKQKALTEKLNQVKDKGEDFGYLKATELAFQALVTDTAIRDNKRLQFLQSRARVAEVFDTSLQLIDVATDLGMSVENLPAISKISPTDKTALATYSASYDEIEVTPNLDNSGIYHELIHRQQVGDPTKLLKNKTFEDIKFDNDEEREVVLKKLPRGLDPKIELLEVEAYLKQYRYKKEKVQKQIRQDTVAYLKNIYGTFGTSLDGTIKDTLVKINNTPLKQIALGAGYKDIQKKLEILTSSSQKALTNLEEAQKVFKNQHSNISFAESVALAEVTKKYVQKVAFLSDLKTSLSEELLRQLRYDNISIDQSIADAKAKQDLIDKKQKYAGFVDEADPWFASSQETENKKTSGNREVNKSSSPRALDKTNTLLSQILGELKKLSALDSPVISTNPAAPNIFDSLFDEAPKNTATSETSSALTLRDSGITGGLALADSNQTSLLARSQEVFSIAISSAGSALSTFQSALGQAEWLTLRAAQKVSLVLNSRVVVGALKAANAMESIALPFIPFGKEIKKFSQPFVPYALAAGATHFLGAAEMIHGAIGETLGGAGASFGAEVAGNIFPATTPLLESAGAWDMAANAQNVIIQAQNALIEGQAIIVENVVSTGTQALGYGVVDVGTAAVGGNMLKSTTASLVNEETYKQAQLSGSTQKALASVGEVTQKVIAKATEKTVKTLALKAFDVVSTQQKLTKMSNLLAAAKDIQGTNPLKAKGLLETALPFAKENVKLLSGYVEELPSDKVFNSDISKAKIVAQKHLDRLSKMLENVNNNLADVAQTGEEYVKAFSLKLGEINPLENKSKLASQITEFENRAKAKNKEIKNLGSRQNKIDDARLANKAFLEEAQKGLDVIEKTLIDKKDKAAIKAKGNAVRTIKATIRAAEQRQETYSNNTPKQTGESVVDGFMQGVGQKKKQAVDMAQKLAVDFNAAFTKEEEIHSPSRKWMRIGRDIIEGLRLGILEKSKKVQETLAYLLAKQSVVVAKFKESIPKVINQGVDKVKNEIDYVKTKKATNLEYKKLKKDYDFGEVKKDLVKETGSSKPDTKKNLIGVLNNEIDLIKARVQLTFGGISSKVGKEIDLVKSKILLSFSGLSSNVLKNLDYAVFSASSIKERIIQRSSKPPRSYITEENEALNYPSVVAADNAMERLGEYSSLVPEKLKDSLKSVAGAFGFLGQKILALASLAGVFGLLTVGVRTFGKSILDASYNAASIDRLTSSISRIRGDKAGKEITKITKASASLGLSLEDSLQGYSQFASSTIGSSLENKASDYYLDIITATKKSGLTPQRQELALSALTQTVSKGRLYSEELRGQLAEHLPSAIPIAAKSLGFESSRDFLEQTKSKEGISASEFIPAFTTALAVQTSTQNTNNLLTATEKFKATSTNIGADLAASLSKALTVVVDKAEQLLVLFSGLGKAISEAFVPVTTGILVAAFGNLFDKTSIFNKSISSVFEKLKDAFNLVKPNSATVAKALGSLAANLGIVALSAVAVKSGFELFDYLSGKTSAIYEQTEALKKLNAELTRRLNLEKPNTIPPVVERNDKSSPEYYGKVTGIGSFLVNSINRLQGLVGETVTSDKKSTEAFETIEGVDNLNSERKGFIATESELVFSDTIANQIPRALQNILDTASSLRAGIPKLAEDIKQTDIELTALDTEKQKITDKGERSRFIAEKIVPTEERRASLASQLAVRQQGIDSLKEQGELLKANTLKKAGELGFTNSKGVTRAIADIDLVLKALTSTASKTLTSIASLSDALAGANLATEREKEKALILTRDQTRQTTEKEALFSLANPLGDKQTTLNSAKVNLDKNLQIYRNSRSNLNAVSTRLENDDTKEILKSLGLSKSSSLEKIQSKKDKVLNSKDTQVLELLESFVNQREANSQNLSAYANSLSSLKDAEYRFTNSFVAQTQKVNLLRNELDRSANFANNANKRKVASLKLTGREKVIAEATSEKLDLDFRIAGKKESISLASDFLTKNKKAQALFKQYSIGLLSPLEKVNQVLADQPLDREQNEIGVQLQGYLQDLTDLDNLLTQQGSSLENVGSATYEFAKSLASIFNGLQDGITTALRSLQDARLASTNKLRTLNQQINQKLNELTSVNLDIANVISKRNLTGQSEITGLVTQAIDSINNLKKSELGKAISLEQAQFDLDQRMLDAQTELIQIQRELTDAIRQAYLAEQQNAETLGVIRSDGKTQSSFERANFDPVIEQTRKLEALNLPNVKVIWNTPDTPIKTIVTNSNEKLGNIKPNSNKDLVSSTITKGIATQKITTSQLELDKINQSFTLGDKSIIAAINQISLKDGLNNNNKNTATKESATRLPTEIVKDKNGTYYDKNNDARNYDPTHSFLTDQINKGGVFDFGLGENILPKLTGGYVEASRTETLQPLELAPLELKSTPIIPVNKVENKPDISGTGVIEFGTGEVFNIKNGISEQIKKETKYHINLIQTKSDNKETDKAKVDTLRTVTNTQIKDTLNNTKPTQIYRGEDLLKVQPIDAMTVIQDMLGQQIDLTKQRFDVIVDSVNQQKKAALDLFDVESDLARQKYQLDYETSINDSRARQRSYENANRNSAQVISQTAFETKQLQSSDPSLNRGLQGINLRQNLGEAQLEKEKADSLFKVSNRELELKDSQSALTILEKSRLGQSGQIANEIDKEITLAKRQIGNLETILNLEKEQLNTLTNQSEARREFLRLSKENETLTYEVGKNRFTSENSLTALDYYANPEITGNRFDSDRLTLEIAQRRELLALREREAQIKTQALNENYSEADKNLALQGSFDLYETNLQKVQDSTNTFANIFKETLTSPLTNFFGDLISGSKSLGETVLNLASGIVSSLGQIASQMIANYILSKTLGSLFGVGGGGGGFGSAVSGLIGGAFAYGGTVGNKTIDLVQAYKNERLFGGGEPQLIMATKGEEVLSLRTGDAQLYRQMKQNGEWDKIKEIKPMAFGGTVGGNNSYSSNKQNTSNNTTIINQTKYDIKTPNANSFSKSRGQLDAETNNRFRRSTRFSQ